MRKMAIIHMCAGSENQVLCVGAFVFDTGLRVFPENEEAAPCELLTSRAMHYMPKAGQAARGRRV
jgi:hypothetical protein